MKEPKDLGIKIGTKDQVYWTNALEQAEELVLKGRNDLIINETIVELAKTKIAKEVEKLK